MDLCKTYTEDYLLDSELEIPEFGFHVSIEGRDLFLGNHSKHRCFRSIRRHLLNKGYKIYAVNCSDDAIHMIVGNCTLGNIQKDLRIFFASYSVFMIMTNNPVDHEVLIRLITSADDFMNTFYSIAILNMNDFADM